MVVTHCNIIAMAIKSESTVEGGAERGGKARMSRGRNGRRDFQQLKWRELFSVWNTECVCSRATALHRVFYTACFCHAASSPCFTSAALLSFFFTSSSLSSSFLFRLPGAVIPQVSQEECVFHCWFTLTRAARMFEHAKAAR